jgi:exonuclease VII small subunit
MEMLPQIAARRIITSMGPTTMSQPIDEAKAELEAAQSALDSALMAWDESVSELWRTSLALTQAQKRLTRAHELLRTPWTDRMNTRR